MHRKFLLWGAFFGGMAVILGAFGAHRLERLTQDEKILHAYQTAVQYQFYHAMALLGVGILHGKFNRSPVRLAGYFFIAGTLLFSGSLYLITLLKLNGNATNFVGPMTPLGGACLIAAWAMLFIGLMATKGSEGQD